MNEDRTRSKYLFAALIPAVITAIVYLSSLDNGFVNWDDNLYVYDNPGIRSMDSGFFRSFVLSVFLNNWTPLTMLTYGIDYAIWGLDPFGYHLTNLIFHLLDTFLAGYLASHLVRISLEGRGTISGKLPLYAGIFTGLLFGLHPAHVESVAWISERKDVVSGLFFLLSVLFYLRYAKGAGKARVFCYVLSLLSFILAIAGKPMAVTLPVVLLIVDLYPLGRFGTGLGEARKIIVEKLPFFAISALTAVVTVLAQRSGMASAEVLPMSYRLFSAARAYAFYLYKLVFPANLAPFYPLEVRFDIFSIEYLGSLVLFAALTICALVIWRVKKAPFIFAAWAYFVVTLLPVVGLLQAGSQSAADRYTYLPSISIFMLFGAGIGLLVIKCRAGRSRIIFTAIALLVTLVFGIKTYSQIGIWKDPITLWSHELEYLGTQSPERQVEIGEGTFETVSPAVLAHYKRALWYAKLGDVASALADYEKTIELNPAFSDAYLNRGVLFARKGELDMAIDDFTNAIRYNPGRALLYYNRAKAYRALGQDALADEDLFKGESLEGRERQER